MKIKTKFLSLLFALFMFLVSITTFGVAVTANAGETMPMSIVPEDPDVPYDPDRNERTSLYYFSDYYESKDYFETGYVRNYMSLNPNITHSELFYYAPENFWGMIYHLVGELDIENAFVIFEVRYSFSQKIIATDDEREEYTDWYMPFGFLYDLFYELHENKNCKIMFICGTDEVRFEDYNAFLEFVDIHINLDMSTLYHYTAIESMEAVCGDNWGGTTIVIDVSIGDSWSFYKTLILYLICKFGNGHYNWTPEYLLKDLNVTVFFYRPGGGYVDPYMPSYEDPDQYFMQKWSDAENGFIISGLPTSENEELWELEYYRSVDSFTDLYEFDYDWGNCYNWCVEETMEDFFVNDIDSLKKYDNWDGACWVTHKPVIYTDDAWLRVPQRRLWLDLKVDLTQFGGFEYVEDIAELLEFLNSREPEFARWW